LINVAAYVSLAGGTVSIMSALSLAHEKLWQEKRKLAASRQTYRKALLKIGLLAILLAGGFGSLVAIVVTFVFGLVIPLFFTNFVTALFLGNSIVFGLFARTKLASSNKEFSYFKLIKESIRKPSLKVDAGLGIIGAIAFMALFSVTLGSSITSTFSTASMRIISLPLYTLLFAFIFVFYESFFKVFVRPMMGEGVKRMVYSVLFELAVLFLTYLLELVVITTILSLFMPFISLGFFVLGINLVLIPLVTSIVSAEVFYERTGGWISQIIISSLIFATLSVVFSPALRFF